MAFISTSSIAAGVRARELTASRKKSTVCSRATVRQSRHERSIPSAQRVATFLTARAFVSGAPLFVRSITASISSRTFELVCQDPKPGELTELESELGEIPDTYADGRPVILRRNGSRSEETLKLFQEQLKSAPDFESRKYWAEKITDLEQEITERLRIQSQYQPGTQALEAKKEFLRVDQ
eukprot:CAMPEP_0184331554 /NCGR_PEP_ID=MMETSP1089-20130417/867_1 /TAXON_ID=38269 ORGANISM="Gloeochaete wittrockiana, Strain SAG46.84" /NCGR_SAMPLE_ID=MMETSP1089 /ASSEMBLY_ACC=CAM_ASM_000445 /LENGTH=180 /DNA_ID=CAMNT_0026654531 /DNA_START=126 /DNA_END=665 /DNA_ORIENTATION=+